MSCGERIKLKRIEAGLTQEELGQKVGLSFGSISKYEKNQISIPADKLLDIANVFGVSVDYLLGNITIHDTQKEIEDLCQKHHLTNTEFDLIFNSLINEKTINLSLLNSTNSKISEIYSNIIKIYLDYLASTNNTSNTNTIDDKFINMLKQINKYQIIHKEISNIFPMPDTAVNVPIVGKISAGVPILAIENIIDYAFAPASQIKDGFEYFYLYVKGDSMNLKFNEGDLILVQQQDYLEEKEIGVFLIDKEEATVKQFREQKGNILILDPMSSNPINHTQMYDIKETPVNIIGKVIAYQGRL